MNKIFSKISIKSISVFKLKMFWSMTFLLITALFTIASTLYLPYTDIKSLAEQNLPSKTNIKNFNNPLINNPKKSYVVYTNQENNCFVYLSDLDKKVFLKNASTNNYVCGLPLRSNDSIIYREMRESNDGHSINYDTTENIYFTNINKLDFLKLYDLSNDNAGYIQITLLSNKGDKVLIITNKKALVYELNQSGSKKIIDINLQKNFTIDRFIQFPNKGRYILSLINDISDFDINETSIKFSLDQEINYDRKFRYKLDLNLINGDLTDDVEIVQ